MNWSNLIFLWSMNSSWSSSRIFAEDEDFLTFINNTSGFKTRRILFGYVYMRLQHLVNSSICSTLIFEPWIKNCSLMYRPYNIWTVLESWHKPWPSYKCNGDLNGTDIAVSFVSIRRISWGCTRICRNRWFNLSKKFD